MCRPREERDGRHASLARQSTWTLPYRGSIFCSLIFSVPSPTTTTTCFPSALSHHRSLRLAPYSRAVPGQKQAESRSPYTRGPVERRFLIEFSSIFMKILACRLAGHPVTFLAMRQPFTVEIALLFVFSLSNSLFLVPFFCLSGLSHTQEQAGNMPWMQPGAPSPSYNRDGSEKVRTFDKRTHRH